MLGIKLPISNSVMAEKTRGNWDFVDDDSGCYSTLFAANYATVTPLPEWGIIPKHSGNVAYGTNSLVEVNEEVLKLKQCDLNEALSNNMSITPNDFLHDLCLGSRFDGVWFDYGIGIAKDVAYKNFWNSLCSLNELFFEIGQPKFIHGECIVDGVKHLKVLFSCAAINDSKEWVVVGDWIIGKRVGEEILIREKWQHHRRRFGDIVLVLSK